MTALRKCFSVVFFVIASLSVVSPASAADTSEWRVVEHAGDVRLTTGTTQVSLTTTTNIGPGSVLETGANGHAMLSRGKESIVVAPNSRMSLPEDNRDGFTRVLQDFGTALFQVEKKNKRHFSVETPYLAAVVKGTRFTVDLTTEQPSVFVFDGAVEVADFSSQTTTMVYPGETVSVMKPQSQPGQSEPAGRNDTPEAREANSKGSPGPQNASAQKSAAIDYAAVTNGLVNPAGKTTGAVSHGLGHASQGQSASNNAGGASNALHAAGTNIASDPLGQVQSLLNGNNGQGSGGNNGLGWGAGGNPNPGGGPPPAICALVPHVCD